MAAARMRLGRARCRRPRAARARSRPAARIRWDRVGRVAMLFALVVLLYLAISPVRSLIADLHLAAARRAQVVQLQQKAAALAAEERDLLLLRAHGRPRPATSGSSDAASTATWSAAYPATSPRPAGARCPRPPGDRASGGSR